MPMFIYDVPALATFRVYAKNEKDAIEALYCHARDTDIELVLNEKGPRVEFVNVTTNPGKAEYIDEIPDKDLKWFSRRYKT